MNLEIQYYRNIKLRQINRNYSNRNARRFTLNETNQNVWIPCKHLKEDGTIKQNEDIDYIFFKAKNQLKLAGYKIKIVEGND